MKKALLIFTLCAVALGFAIKAEARGFPIPITFGAEKIITVVDLPNDSTTYVSKEASVSGGEFDMGFTGYCNIGYFYKQFSLLWIPLWNYDGKYCLVMEGGQTDTYYRLSDEAIQQMKEKYSLPDNPIRFWHKIGGKIFFPLLIIGLIAWGSNRKKKREEETSGAE